MTKGRYFGLYVLLIAGVLALFCVGLIRGSVRIPLTDVLNIIFGHFEGREAWRIIVLETRLPQTVTALLAGAALSVSGLMLQTLFKNPLAGPSILGISDGANLGVAIAMIWLGAASYLSTIVAALIGAAVVLLMILWFSHRVSGNVMLLIIGIMLGYLASSVISILNYQASADKVHQYVMWGMGDFSGVSLSKLPWLAGFVVAGLFCSLLLVKPLNAMLLGESYAANLGVNVRRARVLILTCTGILTAVVTAFCGPISFLGLAVPHIARLLTGTDNHRHLLPVTLLSGCVIALLCSILTVWPGSNSLLPLSAVTPVVGVPVILYVIVNRRNQHYFN
ncbi:iron complex transport system permease protein [Bacteroidales bacterium WCE2004]|nr:iron complex transport system permease protein [Bacteroidales bacterium WCE2004]